MLRKVEPVVRNLSDLQRDRHKYLTKKLSFWRLHANSKERVASSAKPNNVSKRKLEFFPFCLYSKQTKVCQADLNRFNKETYCVFRKVEPGVKPRRRKKKKKNCWICWKVEPCVRYLKDLTNILSCIDCVIRNDEPGVKPRRFKKTEFLMNLYKGWARCTKSKRVNKETKVSNDCVFQ